MHCTLLIPDLLPSQEYGIEPYAGLRLPSLETLLARGTTKRQTATTPENWLCDRFRVPQQQDRPLAALMLKADGGTPGGDYWLCADPIQLRVDSNRLIVAGRTADLDALEAHELIAALNQHFAPDNFEFYAPTPLRWYLRTTRIPRIVTTPLAQALNRSVKHHLPAGEDALAWLRVVNEAQMILHAHPVTAARDARGATAINSIWLWGGGTLPQTLDSPFVAAWGGQPIVRALASAANLSYFDLPATAGGWRARASNGHHLLVFDAPAEALRMAGAAAWRDQLTSFDEQWIRPLLQALRENTLTSLTLLACSHASLLEIVLVRADQRRFWRRARPLAEYAGKP